jgi:uncharacterized membrane-anchored protein
MKKVSIIAGILALVFCISVLVGTSEAVLAQGHGCGHEGKGFWSNLTEDQREAVHEKIKEMRSQNATPDEIHGAITEMLKGYGIEVPEDWEGPHGRGGFGPGPGDFCKDLTKEQREAVKEKTKEMRSQGSTREEIHSAVTEMLKGYGIEIPPADSIGPPHGRGGFGPGPGVLRKDLTKEQREAVKEKTKEMRSQGSTREEIHTAVTEMLKGYGIEIPPADSIGPPHGRGGFGPGPNGFWKDLTKEQREAIQEKIKEMRSNGSTPEETHSAVAEMLKGYGIQVPEDWHGPIGFGPKRDRFGANLTVEQKEAVREKIKEMRNQGAKREEIRAAVAEMIKGFGIKSPQDSENASSGTASAVPNIIAQSYPNPFNPETHIYYALNTPENVRVQIFNVAGQLIRTFDMGYQPVGSYSVRWDGRNESGDQTASGVYLYRIQAGTHAVTNRMVLLK